MSRTDSRTNALFLEKSSKRLKLCNKTPITFLRTRHGSCKKEGGQLNELGGAISVVIYE